MKLVGFVSALPAAMEMDRELAGPDFEFSYLILDVAREGKWRFIQELRRFLRSLCLRDKKRVLQMYRSGRLCWSSSLTDPSTLRWIGEQSADAGVHGVNVIYPVKVIEMFPKGILNAHIGPLPEIRGRSSLEWSLLTGMDPSVSVIRVDEGIDTGAIWSRNGYPDLRAENSNQLREKLFSYRWQELREALRKICNGQQPLEQLSAEGARYYPVSDLFRSAADRLASSRT